jgi:hypothetical protein
LHHHADQLQVGALYDDDIARGKPRLRPGERPWINVQRTRGQTLLRQYDLELFKGQSVWRDEANLPNLAVRLR